MKENSLLRSPVSGSPADQKPNEYAGSDRRPPTVSGREAVSGQSVQLTPSQDAVARELLEFGRGESEHSIATLMGYAGVGKTTVVAHVVHQLAAMGVRIVVLAPTHKALAVLSEKIDDDAVDTMTLQSALALKVSERPDGTQTVVDKGEEGSLRDYHLAVIDEASMVSEAMFSTALIKRRRCKLLFVGDPAQLPPVDKAVPEDAPRDADGLSPAFGPLVPKRWTMTEVVRQAQGNPIIRVATAARACIDAGQDFSLRTMTENLQDGDDDFMAMQPGGVLEAARLVADAISYGQDTRALAWDNNTVQAINAHVHAMVHPGKGDYPDGTLLMAQDGFPAILAGEVGTKVQVRNSALLTVRGCSAGRHASDPREAYEFELEDESGARMRCWFARDQKQWQADISEHFAEYRRLKLREQLAHGPERDALGKQARAASDAGWALRTRFAPLRYAYAMTVHKSQGSTFDAVVLDWTSFQRCRDVQLRNRLAYVALTRTRKFAVVCA